MTIAAINTAAAAAAYAPLAINARPAIDAAPVPAARTEPRVEVAPVQAAAAVASGAVLAAQAAYDCRVTGASETVKSFDRIAMIEEGFAHLRGVLYCARQQADETFGGFNAMAIDEAMAARRLDIRA